LKAWAVHLKPAFVQMRMYVWGVILLILLGRVADLIVTLSIKSGYTMRLSDGNMLLLILLLTAVILPLTYFKRIIYLGASRQQYFNGLHFVFGVWAAGIALFNSLWYQLEVHIFRDFTGIVDMIEAFHWTDFGVVGSFLYQAAFYVMVMALLSMLASGYSHPMGWLLWALLITAIPVGTAIPSLRVHVAAFFKALLFNSSLLTGVLFNLALYVLFAAGGWWFTQRRTY
jgi:hypothetical protein